jgi:hypothetical protein
MLPLGAAKYLDPVTAKPQQNEGFPGPPKRPIGDGIQAPLFL